MPITEHTINDTLAEALKEIRSLWRDTDVIRSENIQILQDNAKHPDILVAEPNVSPVIVETEVMPAITVENDALQRLGEKILPNGRLILSSLAVRMPKMLREYSGQKLKQEVAKAEYEMALYTGEDSATILVGPK